MNRRAFLKTIGGTGVVVAASLGAISQFDQMPDEAISAWGGPAADLDIREWILSYALLAPNPHNMQAWIADLTAPDQITLYADKSRLLPETDPFSRQVMIGQGTFLELLRIAAIEKGYDPEIDLFPGGIPPQDRLDISESPIAVIRLKTAPNITKDPLFSQILQRRSNKEKYEQTPLKTNHRDELLQLSLFGNQQSILFIEEAQVAQLRQIAGQAMLLEMQTPRTLRESVDRTRIGSEQILKHRDGIDLHGPMFWILNLFDAMSAENAMTPGTIAHQGGIDYALGWAESTYSMGVLISSDNSRESQVIAGQNYVRLNLRATQLGVAMHPVSQVLQEYPEMSTLQSKFNSVLGLNEDERVQMFYRIGYQDQPSPSPRRPLGDILSA